MSDQSQVVSAQPVSVGVVDSGFSPETSIPIQSSSAFVIEQDQLWQSDQVHDPFGHGSRVVEVIHQLAPTALIHSARVFSAEGRTSALQVAAAIDWLVEQRVDLINLSLGLRADRPVLREACERALERGIVLCASSPAQGEAVFPAAIPGVIRATGDARCGHEDLVWLETAQADVAGCVLPMSNQRGLSGASMGCAHVSGHLARMKQQGCWPHPSAVPDVLAATARWQGREYKTHA